MSADELRQAAETLRQRAKAATSGPWISEQWEDSLQVTAGTASTVWTDHGDFRTGRQPSSYNTTDVIVEHTLDGWGEDPNNLTETQWIADAAYIATMHPGVGRALADWLDEAAGLADALDEDPFFVKPEGLVRMRDNALTLARLINGGAS